MQFEQVSVVDNIDIPFAEQAVIGTLSVRPVDFPIDDPIGDDAIAERVAGADAVLVSWRTPVTAAVMAACPSIRYIGLAASAYAKPESCNVDLDAARKAGVVVSTLGQYGDEATAEWIIAMMLNVASHLSELHWKPERRELFGKTLGIIGMGHMGRHVAQRASALGMRVVYWSRARKADAEAQGYEYLALDSVLRQADVVSIHVGKGVQVMGANEFEALKPGVMLVNTSLGPVFEPASFAEWIGRKDGIVFSDKDVDPALAESMTMASNAWISPQSAGDSQEMKERKGRQLYENLCAYLEGSPTRVAPVE